MSKENSSSELRSKSKSEPMLAEHPMVMTASVMIFVAFIVAINRGFDTGLVLVLVGFAFCTITSALALAKVTSMNSKIIELRSDVNVRMTQLIELSIAAAHTKGQIEGEESQRQREAVDILARAEAAALVVSTDKNTPQAVTIMETKKPLPVVVTPEREEP
jgi:hypothetical protein